MANSAPNYILIQDADVLIEEEDGDVEYEEFEVDDEEQELELEEEEEENVLVPAARVSREAEAMRNISEQVKEESEKRGEGETTSCDEKMESQEWRSSEIEGLFCPICMEAWTNGGNHQVWCASSPSFIFILLSCLKFYFLYKLIC